MLSMLRDGGWRRMVRPIDGKEFTNDTVEQWVLGAPWAGLYFPSWDALYAMLERDPEDGPECKRMLIEHGAPADGKAADAPALPKHGGSRRQGDVVTLNARGSSTTYLAGRLKRDRPELAEAVIAGRLSAHAAAVQAGFVKPTWTAPADPERLAVAIEKRFPGYRLVRAA